MFLNIPVINIFSCLCSNFCVYKHVIFVFANFKHMFLNVPFYKQMWYVQIIFNWLDLHSILSYHTPLSEKEGYLIYNLPT